MHDKLFFYTLRGIKVMRCPDELPVLKQFKARFSNLFSVTREQRGFYYAHATFRRFFTCFSHRYRVPVSTRSSRLNPRIVIGSRSAGIQQHPRRMKP